jgi:hypothetical protein
MKIFTLGHIYLYCYRRFNQYPCQYTYLYCYYPFSKQFAAVICTKYLCIRWRESPLSLSRLSREYFSFFLLFRKIERHGHKNGILYSTLLVICMALCSGTTQALLLTLNYN